jgi:hypothetical protein
LTGTPRKPWNSGARIDASTFVLMADASALRASLAPIGVELSSFPHAPPGTHPVCFDLWHVRDGRIEAAGVDQHAWSATAGAATTAAAASWLGGTAGMGLGALQGATRGGRLGNSLGPLGWIWGATGGWVAGGVWGGAAGAAVGALRGAAVGASTARSMSHAMSRSYGNYDEVMVTVPNALRPGGQSERHLFVLGTYSNGPVSILGDRLQRCGYGKRPRNIHSRGWQHYDVCHGSASACLSAAFDSTGERPGGRAGERAGQREWVPVDARLDPFRALFAQPLLGHRRDGSFAVSFLDRFLDAPEIRWTPVSGRITVTRDFMARVPAGEFELPGLSVDRPWGAFQATSILAKITPPHDT